MMKLLFIVQGEGRGHLTQAIAMYEILTRNGHKVVATIVGLSKNKHAPDFYIDSIKAPIYTIQSPYLNFGNGKSLNLLKTIAGQLRKAKKYLSNAKAVNDAVSFHKPDAILNFYEMTAGFYSYYYKQKVPIICIGHQYLISHKEFETIKGKAVDRMLLNVNTRLTSIGSSRKLALSFTTMNADIENKITVIPPLLRSSIKLAKVESKNFLLAYVTNHNLLEDLLEWQGKNSETKIHCFLDKKDIEDDTEIQKNFRIYKIDANHFIEKMAKCKGLITTAGFESVCEAMYLGKPVMMVPIKKHIEQRINAHDGQRAGAGIYNSKFNISKFIDYIPQHKDVSSKFKKWLSKGDDIIINTIETVIKEFHENTIN